MKTLSAIAAIISVTSVTPFLAPAIARAVTPENNPNCHKIYTNTTIYGSRYNVPGFKCFDNYSMSIVVDVSNLTSNFDAVERILIPRGTNKIFIRYQDGRVRNETEFWGLKDRN